MSVVIAEVVDEVLEAIVADVVVVVGVLDIGPDPEDPKIFGKREESEWRLLETTLGNM